MKGKVIIALNTAWNLYNFRAGLILALAAEGHEAGRAFFCLTFRSWADFATLT